MKKELKYQGVKNFTRWLVPRYLTSRTSPCMTIPTSHEHSHLASTLRDHSHLTSTSCDHPTLWGILTLQGILTSCNRLQSTNKLQ